MAGFNRASLDTVLRACMWLETVEGLPVTAQALRWYAHWLIGRGSVGSLIVLDELAAELRAHFHGPFATGEA